MGGFLMNIFAVHKNPFIAASQLPEKYLTKMPVETCQMLAVIYSKWYHDWGKLPKASGGYYSTTKGAFRNHPCTQWAAHRRANLAWLIQHGFGLCSEYTRVYGKTHACEHTLYKAARIFKTNIPFSLLTAAGHVTRFARAMPDDIKKDYTITDTQAYQKYLLNKDWVVNNYERDPFRKPSWIIYPYNK